MRMGSLRRRSHPCAIDRALGPNLEAVKLNPEFEEAWHNLGQTYLGTGEFVKSVSCFERVLQLGSGIPETHCLMGIG
jgi:Tetratricopeptide repeat